jgi:hypothetical protein
VRVPQPEDVKNDTRSAYWLIGADVSDIRIQKQLPKECLDALIAPDFVSDYDNVMAVIKPFCRYVKCKVSDTVGWEKSSLWRPSLSANDITSQEQFEDRMERFHVADSYSNCTPCFLQCYTDRTKLSPPRKAMLPRTLSAGNTRMDILQQLFASDGSPEYSIGAFHDDGGMPFLCSMKWYDPTIFTSEAAEGSVNVPFLASDTDDEMPELVSSDDDDGGMPFLGTACSAA